MEQLVNVKVATAVTNNIEILDMKHPPVSKIIVLYMKIIAYNMRTTQLNSADQKYRFSQRKRTDTDCINPEHSTWKGLPYLIQLSRNDRIVQ